MKKKFISSVVAALMVLTMGTTVFAAGSPVAGVADDKNFTVTTVTEEEKATVTKDAAAKAEEAVNSNTVSAKATVLAVYDIKPTEAMKAELKKNGKVTVTLNADVKAGEKVMIYHVKDDGSSELLTATVVDGKVSFDVKGFSTFAIVKVTETYVEQTYGPNNWDKATWDQYWNASNAATTAATGAATSPKTGEAPVAAVVALICLAGVAVCGKKVKFN